MKFSTLVFTCLSMLITTFVGFYVLIVESIQVAINEDNKMEEEINFDEITIDDYCNTPKGRADVFCKQELWLNRNRWNKSLLRFYIEKCIILIIHLYKDGVILIRE